jgi:outer membrane lipoprotein-sorting protein
MTIFRKWTAAAAIMIVFLSSCQQNDPVSQVVEPYTFSKDYTVNYQDWQQGNDDESGMYYYKTFKESSLTQYIFDNGTMQAFLMYNDGTLSPLPFNDYWVEDGTGYMYTEQITCEFVPGSITFIVKSSDHQDILPHYDNYNFNVRFMW